MRPRLLALAVVLMTDLLAIGPLLAQSIRIPTMQKTLADFETFKAAKLSSNEANGILKQIEETSFDYPNSWQSELRVRRLSLGDTDGLVVRGTRLLCGGTGNCQTWVFRQQSNGRWVSMFQRQAPIISAFGFADHTSRGIRDLVTLADASAETSSYNVFAFDGNFYREAECYELSGVGNDAAKWRSRKQPCLNAN
jgi:hypothetical protein